MLLPRLKPLAAPEGRSSYPPLPSNPQGRTSVAALNGKDKMRLLAAVRDPVTNRTLCILKKAVVDLKTRNGHRPKLSVTSVFLSSRVTHFSKFSSS